MNTYNIVRFAYTKQRKKSVRNLFGSELKKTADIIRKYFKDEAYRIGGDEFGITGRPCIKTRNHFMAAGKQET